MDRLAVHTHFLDLFRPNCDKTKSGLGYTEFSRCDYIMSYDIYTKWD